MELYKNRVMVDCFVLWIVPLYMLQLILVAAESTFNVSIFVVIGDYPANTRSSITSSDDESTYIYEDKYDDIDANFTSGMLQYDSILINDGCYIYKLESYEIESVVSQDSIINWQRPSYYLYLNNVQLTLNNQSHSMQRDTSSKNFETSLYFCTQMFSFSEYNTNLTQNHSNSNSNNDNNNVLTITFESYPENLILQISSYDTVLYENRFGELSTDNENVYLSNHTLQFSNLNTSVNDGCFGISMIDANFDNTDFDVSGLNHVRYRVLVDDEYIVAYGGYYGESESITFCNDFYGYCNVPYQCSNMSLGSEILYTGYIASDNVKSIINANSFKSFYNSRLMDDLYDVETNCNGAYSCENLVIESALDSQSLGCYGVYSCFDGNFYFGLELWQTFMECNAFNGCMDVYGRVESKLEIIPFTLHWYVCCVFFFFVFI